MNIVKCNRNVKCDMPDCRNRANYYIENERRALKAVMFLCNDCMVDLHKSIGKVITPKSPKNMLNLDKNNQEGRKHEK